MNERRAALLTIAVGLIFVALVIFAAAGPRGSDQFWYLADVQTLVDGGPHVSNDVFPVALLANGKPERAPFVHDTLNLYLVWPFAEVLGSYRGWIAANLLATLLCAALIGHTIYVASARQSRTVPWIAAGLFLAYPLTFWQACQPLIESTSTLFVVAALWAYVVLSHWSKYVAVVISLGLGLWCRGSLLPLLGLAALLPLVELRGRRAFSFLLTVALLGSAFFFVKGASMFFESAMPTDLKTVLMNATPGGSNMDFMLQPNLQFGWDTVFRKFVFNLKSQFWTGATLQMFYAPFNLLAALALIIGLRRGIPPQLRRLWCVALALLAVHFATILLHQNQARYMLLTMPGLMVCCGVWLHHKKWQVRLAPSALALIGALAVSAVMARHLRVDSLRTQASITTVRNVVDQRVGADELVLLEGMNQLISSTVAPRLVLTVQAQTPSELRQKLVTLSGASWEIRPARAGTSATNSAAEFKVMGYDYQLAPINAK